MRLPGNGGKRPTRAPQTIKRSTKSTKALKSAEHHRSGALNDPVFAGVQLAVIGIIAAQGPNNARALAGLIADALRSWADRLMETKPFKLVAVATANKLARIVFALMRDKVRYAGTPA